MLMTGLLRFVPPRVAVRSLVVTRSGDIQITNMGCGGRFRGGMIAGGAPITVKNLVNFTTNMLTNFTTKFTRRVARWLAGPFAADAWRSCAFVNPTVRRSLPDQCGLPPLDRDHWSTATFAGARPLVAALQFIPLLAFGVSTF